MDDITFKRIEFERPIIDILGETRPRVIGQPTLDVLRSVENSSGFIAGGFAARVAYAHSMIGDIRTNVDSREYLTRYISMQSLTKKTWATHRKYAKIGVGDIDVYFEDPNRAAKLIDDVSLLGDNYHLEPTSAGFGWEVACFGRETNLVQLITKYGGTPKEVCSTFDIYNAACVIKGNCLYVPEEWEWLAKNRYLHLRKWNGPWVMQRMSKWVRKHHYDRGLTPQSVTLLNDHIVEMLDDPEKTKTQATAYKFIFKQLHPFMSSIRPEHLMKITMLYPQQAYNYALEELKRRSEMTLSRVALPNKPGIITSDLKDDFSALLDD